MSETTEEPPLVVVIGGCNGAGKTTASRALLAETLGVMTFVNTDVIARGLSGFDVERAQFEAGRLTLQRLQQLAAARESFAFETTLSGRAYATTLRELRVAGYRVELYYFWLKSADLSIERVARRVASGGHNVPEDTLRQRYPKSVDNFRRLYRPLADLWRVYDNSVYGDSVPVAEGGLDRPSEVFLPERWSKIQGGTDDD